MKLSHNMSGLYITFSIWGAMSLAEVEKVATLQSFTLGGSGGMLPLESLVILGVLRYILRHTGLICHRAS